MTHDDDSCMVTLWLTVFIVLHREFSIVSFILFEEQFMSSY